MRLLNAAIIAFLIHIGNLVVSAQTSQRMEPDGRVASEDIPLRLRAGPGLDFAVLDLLPDGTPLAITGRTADSSWLQVHTLDQYRAGWVYGEYVDASIDLQTRPISTSQLSFSHLISGISDNARLIFQRGQTRGNRPNVFAKVGDSITTSHHMFQPIGEGKYDLSEYDYLLPAIDYFRQAEPARNNFTRRSVAAGVGWNAAAVLLPAFADPNQCLPDEIPLACEYRLIRPAFALIMFGTNDVGYVPDIDYRHNLERIVRLSIEHGVVPVVSTVPPRIGYDEKVLRFNQIVRDIAYQFDVPLWDYHYAMAFYARTSLAFDGVHPSLPPRGHEDAASFREENLPYGYVLRNLSALHVLDALWREVVLDVTNP